MLTIPQVERDVKALPAPLHLKAQILDALIGQHDCLDKNSSLRMHRPMTERVAEARRIGGFRFLRTLPSGDDVYAYCKRGVPFYRVTARDGAAVWCTCKNQEMESAKDPEHRCKHIRLFDEAGQTLEDMLAELSAASGQFERAAAEWQLGIGSAAAADGAHGRLEAARERVQALIPSEGAVAVLTQEGRNLLTQKGRPVLPQKARASFPRQDGLDHGDGLDHKDALDHEEDRKHEDGVRKAVPA